MKFPTYFFVIEAFHSFWKQNPALLYAFSFLLGIYSSLQWNFIFLIPISIIIIPLLFKTHLGGLKRRFLLAIALFLASFSFIQFNYQFPFLPPVGIPGTAYFGINSVSAISTPFGKRWLYKGEIYSFTDDSQQKKVARNIPFSLGLPLSQEVKRPDAGNLYKVSATLKESATGRYILSIGNDTPWYGITKPWNLAEFRMQAKNSVGAYIKKIIPSERAAVFLTGIATGDFDDRLMQYEFSRFGLQHIMAISGFHFAIIAGILSLCFRLILPKKSANLFLIFLLSLYVLFLGGNPSVLRAFTSVMIILFGYLFERRGSGLNSLGLAMILVLAIDPLMSKHIGFQFSFITTSAILIFYGGADSAMQKIFAKRPLGQVVEMDALNQHAYCFLAFFRQAMALTIAVNIVAMPIMLFYFQKFPVMSLVYNLFFPFLVSFSMLLLIFGFLGSFLFPPFGTIIHQINSVYTEFMLNFTYNLPTKFDVILRTSNINLEVLVVYLCLALILGICFKYFQEIKSQEYEDFAFI